MIPTPPTSSVSSNACICTERALEIVETLGGNSDEMSNFYGFSALNTQRRALRQYQHLLTCDDCLRKTTHLTLLIMVLKQMAEFGDNIVSRHFNFQYVFSRDSSRLTFKHGSYEIDSEDEMRAVIQTLTALQLRDMMHLMQRVSSSGVFQMKETHFMSLHSAQEQVKGSIARLRQGRPCSAQQN